MRQLTLRILAVTSLATIFIIPASSQDGGVVFAGGGGIGIGSAGAMVGPAGLRSMSGNEKGSTFTYNFPKGATEFVTTGAPYSGHTSSQTIRTLANGTHLTQQSNDQPMTYRDTMGHTRTEAAVSPRFNGPNAAVATAQPQIMRFAEITDPVAGYKYVLDSVHQIAYRGVIQAQVRPNQNPNAAAAAARMAANPMAARTMENGATIKNESLGTQTIFGVTAIGQRNTTTYPIGTYQGNDQPVVVVNENWRSAQYGLMLRSVNSGPNGDTTMTMKDFSTDEPDPSLFMVPAGYQVVDEVGEFTITIPRDAR